MSLFINFIKKITPFLFKKDSKQTSNRWFGKNKYLYNHI